MLRCSRRAGAAVAGRQPLRRASILLHTCRGYLPSCYTISVLQECRHYCPAAICYLSPSILLPVLLYSCYCHHQYYCRYCQVTMVSRTSCTPCGKPHQAGSSRQRACCDAGESGSSRPVKCQDSASGVRQGVRQRSPQHLAVAGSLVH